MYLYFDKLGKLKEIINDEPLRQGNDNVNTIYCFFEGDRIVNSVDFSVLRNGDSQAITFDQDVDSPVIKEVPYDEKRSLYYFKYFTNYTFYKYTLTQTNLSVSGIIKITIRAYDNTNKIFALGLYVGSVETSALQISSTITNSEYEDLLKVLSTKSRWVDIERYIGVSRQELANLNKTNVIDYLGSLVGSITTLDLTNLVYTPSADDQKTVNVSGSLTIDQLRVVNNFINYKNIKALNVKLPNNNFNVMSAITNVGQIIGYSIDTQSPNVAHYFYISIDLNTGVIYNVISFVYSVATSKDIKVLEDKLQATNTTISDLTARVSKDESLIYTIDTSLDGTIKKLDTVENTAYTALSIAQNKTGAITYNDNANLNSGLPTLGKNALKVGDNVLIIQTEVPDWWVSAINETIGTETLPTIVGGVFNKSYHIGYFTISQLETQSIDLTTYYTKLETDKLLTNFVLKSTLSGYYDKTETDNLLKNYALISTLSNYQTITDNTLNTTSKTIVGAINELVNAGTGGTTVVANNGQATTQELTTLFVDSVNYLLPQGGGGGSVVTKIDYLPNNAPLQGIAIDGVNYRLVQQGSILNKYCLAFGDNSSATGSNSSAFGAGSSASGTGSSATGSNSSAFGNNSSAFGYKSSANGYYSSAFGVFSSATGTDSSAFGSNSKAYVPSWVSIDGIDNSIQRTFTLKDTDHLFFRNENVDSTKTTQSSYTNGKTLTQVFDDYALKSVLASTTQNGLMAIEDKKKLNECFIITDISATGFNFNVSGGGSDEPIPTNICEIIIDNAKNGKYLRIKSDTNETVDIPQVFYNKRSVNIGVLIVYQVNANLHYNITIDISRSSDGVITGKYSCGEV